MSTLSLASSNTNARIEHIAIELLEPNPFQMRQVFDETQMKDLIGSIKSNGILQPVLARPFEGRFQLIDGERRWRASKRVPLQTIAVYVREADDAEMLFWADEANRSRVDITDMDWALWVDKQRAQMIAEGVNPSIRSIAKRIKKDKGWVSSRLKLLEFHQDVQAMLSRNFAALTIAKEINAISNPTRRATYIAVVDAGGSRGEVLQMMEQDRQQDEEQAAKQTAIRAAQTPPDKFTRDAQRQFEQTGSATFGRSLQPVTSDNAADARRAIAEAVRLIETWAPHLSDGDVERLLQPLARRFVRGDLSR